MTQQMQLPLVLRIYSAQGKKNSLHKGGRMKNYSDLLELLEEDAPALGVPVRRTITPPMISACHQSGPKIQGTSNQPVRVQTKKRAKYLNTQLITAHARPAVRKAAGARKSFTTSLIPYKSASTKPTRMMITSEATHKFMSVLRMIHSLLIAQPVARTKRM